MSPAPAAVHEEMEMRQCSEINKREHWRRKTGGSWLHGRPACSRLERCAATVVTVGLLCLAVGSTLVVASSVHDGHCKHQHPKAHEPLDDTIMACSATASHRDLLLRLVTYDHDREDRTRGKKL
uniref:Uncharacterized protein n=1 Tax=Anopheles coluzzii TaxID=1518534 RepID=A0A8W7PT85_ANOCL